MNSIAKRILISVGAVAAVAVAGVALAYFTTEGSGTATEGVGESEAVTLHASLGGNLFPGAASAVTFTVDNPSPGTQRVGTISLDSITPDSGHSSCSTAITGGNPDFTMAPVAVNKVFNSGSGLSVSQTGSLKMNDTGVNQDACQGATLTLHLVNN